MHGDQVFVLILNHYISHTFFFSDVYAWSSDIMRVSFFLGGKQYVFAPVNHTFFGDKHDVDRPSSSSE
jgi:hypothetical protein